MTAQQMDSWLKVKNAYGDYLFEQHKERSWSGAAESAAREKYCEALTKYQDQYGDWEYHDTLAEAALTA